MADRLEDVLVVVGIVVGMVSAWHLAPWAAGLVLGCTMIAAGMALAASRAR